MFRSVCVQVRLFSGKSVFRSVFESIGQSVLSGQSSFRLSACMHQSMYLAKFEFWSS